MSIPHTSLRAAMLAILSVVIVLPVAATAGDRSVAGTDKMRAAEDRLLKDINRIRGRNGRGPLRIDRRTSQVARARSADMAGKRYFGHVEPDGDDAADILDRREIEAKTVTENIGHTRGLTLRAGSRRMATWWFRSAPHRRQMLARDINYIGIGIARRGTRITYTAIFTRARDKDDPVVVIDEATVSHDGSRAVIDWRGRDRRLAVGRNGIRGYDLQRLTRFGGWDRIGGRMRRTEVVLPTLGTGDEHLRVRAVDRAGNRGPWTYARIDTGAGPTRFL